MYVITQDEYESLQRKLAGSEERIKSLEDLVADYESAMDFYEKENSRLRRQLIGISESVRDLMKEIERSEKSSR